MKLTIFFLLIRGDPVEFLSFHVYSWVLKLSVFEYYKDEPKKELIIIISVNKIFFFSSLII